MGVKENLESNIKEYLKKKHTLDNLQKDLESQKEALKNKENLLSKQIDKKNNTINLKQEGLSNLRKRSTAVTDHDELKLIHSQIAKKEKDLTNEKNIINNMSAELKLEKQNIELKQQEINSDTK